MKHLLKITLFAGLLGLAGAALLAPAPAGAATEDDAAESYKVRINPVIKDDVGLTADNVKIALKGLLTARGHEIVETSGADVVEFYAVVGRDDDDDDNDGRTDCGDPDADGDSIADRDEDAEVIDLDAVAADIVDDFPNRDAERGVYVSFYTNADPQNKVRLVTKIDTFKQEPMTARLTNAADAPRFLKVAYARRSEGCETRNWELGSVTFCTITESALKQMKNDLESRQKKIEGLEKQLGCYRTLVDQAKRAREFNYDEEKKKCEALYEPPSAPRVLNPARGRR